MFILKYKGGILRYHYVVWEEGKILSPSFTEQSKVAFYMLLFSLLAFIQDGNILTSNASAAKVMDQLHSSVVHYIFGTVWFCQALDAEARDLGLGITNFILSG